jgi:uncharacterized protein (TIGR02246 family)
MPTETQLRTHIERADKHFEALCERMDAAGLAGLYTADATLLPPGTDMRKGRDAIAEFWRGAFFGGVKNVKLDPIDVEECGPDVAREIGLFSLDTPNGRAEGKYLVVWKREGGEWRLDADIWNTNG